MERQTERLQEQYCKIFLYALEKYSKSTIKELADTIQLVGVNPTTMNQIEEMLKSNPTEQEFLKMLDKEFPNYH